MMIFHSSFIFIEVHFQRNIFLHFHIISRFPLQNLIFFFSFSFDFFFIQMQLRVHNLSKSLDLVSVIRHLPHRRWHNSNLYNVEKWLDGISSMRHFHEYISLIYHCVAFGCTHLIWLPILSSRPKSCIASKNICWIPQFPQCIKPNDKQCIQSQWVSWIFFSWCACSVLKAHNRV